MVACLENFRLMLVNGTFGSTLPLEVDGNSLIGVAKAGGKESGATGSLSGNVICRGADAGTA
jgi:hypothetical protein